MFNNDLINYQTSYDWQNLYNFSKIENNIFLPVYYL